jgi:hypothetical protein
VVDGGDSKLPACDFQGVQGGPYCWPGYQRLKLLQGVEHLTSTKCRTNPGSPEAGLWYRPKWRRHAGGVFYLM